MHLSKCTQASLIGASRPGLSKLQEPKSTWALRSNDSVRLRSMFVRVWHVKHSDLLWNSAHVSVRTARPSLGFVAYRVTTSSRFRHAYLFVTYTRHARSHVRLYGQVVLLTLLPRTGPRRSDWSPSWGRLSVLPKAPPSSR